MSVLSRQEIKRRLRLKVRHSESLVITPLLRPDFDIDSVDLRLGCYFLLPGASHQEPYVCPDGSSSRFFGERVHVPLGDYLVVPAHQTVLGATLEFIKLPC